MSLTPRDLEILSAAFQCLRDPDAFKVGQLITMKGASCHYISLSITIPLKLCLLLRTHSISLSITIHLKLCLLIRTHSSQSITTSLELTILLAQVDYQKLATLAGFKSAASASNSFFLVKKKINAGAGAMAKANTAEKDAEDNANGDEAGGPNHDEGPTTPLTPAAKKRVRKAKAPPASPQDTSGVANGEENGDEPTVPTPSTPKKRARKPKAEPKSGDEATTPKKRARKAAKPKAGEEAKVVTPHSGGDEDSTLPTPASPSPTKKRARKPSSAKAAKKSTEIVAEGATTDEAKNDATAATTIAKAKLADGDNQYKAAMFSPGVAPNKAGTSSVLAAEFAAAAAAAAATEYSKGGQSEFRVLVPGDDADDSSDGENTYAAGQGATPA